MKMLAFDTSTEYASVALWEEGRCLYDATCALGRRHSERLFDAFAHALSMVEWRQEELDAIAVGIGPGSFTGLRVGVATAQGLAFALKCPLYGVNSLEAMCLGAPAGPGLVAATIDARKGEIYISLSERQAWGANPPAALSAPTPLGPTRLLQPDAAAAELAARNVPVLLLGSGAAAYRDLLTAQLGAHAIWPLHAGANVTRGADVAYLAALQAARGETKEAFEVLPLYIRPSEAEMNMGPPEGGPPLAGRMQPDGTVLPPSEEDPQTPSGTE